MSENTPSENQVEIRLLELSESLGYTKHTINWVYGGIGLLSERKKQEVPEGESFHVSAVDVCTALLRDIRSTCKEPIRDILSDLKIESSKDIGRIVYGLVDKKLINNSEDGSITEFDNLFDQSSLNEFLANHGIKEKVLDLRLCYRQLMWFFYSVGTILVVGSYLDIVEPVIAWAGWALAMVGFLMQFYTPPAPKRF